MPDRAFVDTNVIIYLLLGNDSKADRAETLFLAGGRVSVQVLNEFVNVARRKHDTPWEAVQSGLRAIQKAFEVEPVTLDTHRAAVALMQQARYTIYDCLLLAAALQSDCTTFWSEDLRDGQVIDGRLTIRNPFA